MGFGQGQSPVRRPPEYFRSREGFQCCRAEAPKKLLEPFFGRFIASWSSPTYYFRRWLKHPKQYLFDPAPLSGLQPVTNDQAPIWQPRFLPPVARPSQKGAYTATAWTRVSNQFCDKSHKALRSKDPNLASGRPPGVCHDGDRQKQHPRKPSGNTVDQGAAWNNSKRLHK